MWSGMLATTPDPGCRSRRDTDFSRKLSPQSLTQSRGNVAALSGSPSRKRMPPPWNRRLRSPISTGDDVRGNYVRSTLFRDADGIYHHTALRPPGSRQTHRFAALRSPL